MDDFLPDADVSTQEESYVSDDEEEAYFYDSQKERIKIFACRHTYHIRCLKKHYHKLGESEEIFTRK